MQSVFIPTNVRICYFCAKRIVASTTISFTIVVYITIIYKY